MENEKNSGSDMGYERVLITIKKHITKKTTFCCLLLCEKAADCPQKIFDWSATQGRGQRSRSPADTPIFPKDFFYHNIIRHACQCHLGIFKNLRSYTCTASVPCRRDTKSGELLSCEREYWRAGLSDGSLHHREQGDGSGSGPEIQHQQIHCPQRSGGKASPV